MTQPDEIRIDDLPSDLRAVAEIVGLEGAVRLAEALGGAPIYIPTHDSVMRASRDRAIRAEFNGRNYRELAKKHRLCLTSIRGIVDAPGRAQSGERVDKQMKLF